MSVINIQSAITQVRQLFAGSTPADPKVDYTPLPHVDAGPDQVHHIVNIVFGIAGSLAFLFIVIGGLKYILSTGDPAKATSAKNTVIYALVGLIITMLAYSIISFVVSKI